MGMLEAAFEREHNSRKKLMKEKAIALKKPRQKLKNRIDMLEQHIKEYKDDGEYENAMKSDIKLKQIKMFLNEVDYLLGS